MNDDDKKKEVALFRFGVLGELIHANRRRGGQARALQNKAREQWTYPDGTTRSFSAKTIQTWLHAYRKGGFEALYPKARRDKGTSRAIQGPIQELILEMKREDPGRSAALIHRELRRNGIIGRRDFSRSAVERLLKARGRSGSKLKAEGRERWRFSASEVNELWQGDACHGPRLYDPDSGRTLRVKIFGLIDDKSRLVSFLWAGFYERQQDFLRVLLEAVQRRGLPRTILLDNHGSFRGTDVRMACAQLGVQLSYARPRDGASKGKIERFWRTLRAHVLDRIDYSKVTSLSELNLRLMTWVNEDYNARPHAGLGGKTPLSVFEEGSDQIRFVDDSWHCEQAFVGKATRSVLQDSTCSFRGKVYELPAQFRGQRVELRYELLRPSRVWVQDGETEHPLREVEAESNSNRPRKIRRIEQPTQPPGSSGLNSVEDLIARSYRPESDMDDDGEGAACARS